MIPPNVLARADKVKELMVSTLAMAETVTKLLIEKGVIREAELEERAVYQRILNPTMQ
jgi:hypothetical protein